MRKRLLSIVAALLALCAFLAGCGAPNEPEPEEDFSSVFAGTWDLVSFEGSEDVPLADEDIAYMRVYGKVMRLALSEDGSWSLGFTDGGDGTGGVWGASSATACVLTTDGEAIDASLDPATGRLTLSSGPTTMVFMRSYEPDPGADPAAIFTGPWDLVAMSGPEDQVLDRETIRILALSGYASGLDLREDGTWALFIRDDADGSGTWAVRDATTCILTAEGEDAEVLFDPLTGYLVYPAGPTAFIFMRDWDPRAGGAGEYADGLVGSWELEELVADDPEESRSIEKGQDLKDLGYVVTLTLYGDGTYVIDIYGTERLTGYWIATSPTEAMAGSNGTFTSFSYDPDTGRLAHIEGSSTSYYVRTTG
ncbi:MAG: hypothetical protein Q4D39_02670 [Coriobacteriaceae bacterium]|nr:hypothetical protein [Coriobacteriaceae bacterium]